eukprot:TRINITY_DN39693_c0_g1_i1.p1 TRINITY_DN39693_c0_g1~~TRINITY_DN39693_c0_g1_i1.p1  ORF type:complete len:874 (-),score=84.83 TRINITY_DN39693_c0_g1_i1:307-2928(-)
MSIERKDTQWLHERGQLPALRVGSLQLKRVIVRHERTPRVLRDIRVQPNDLAILLQRRVQTTSSNVIMNWDLLGSKREVVRTLAALNVAVMPPLLGFNGTSNNSLWGWGPLVYADRNNLFSALNIPCVNSSNSASLSLYYKLLNVSCTSRSENSSNESNSTTREQFDVEARYMQDIASKIHRDAAAHFVRDHSAKFMGLRRPPCDVYQGADHEQCVDDIGVGASVYESQTHKVIVFAGQHGNDKENVLWTERLNVLERLEYQLRTMWTARARQNMTSDMPSRHGQTYDEINHRCSFKDHVYGEWSNFDQETGVKLGEAIGVQGGKISGLWDSAKLMLRQILPEGRDTANEKTIILTGNGLGGRWAALLSMWLNKMEAVKYQTVVFAPVGFQCMANDNYKDDVNGWAPHNDYVTVYQHVFDAYAELGHTSGRVCLFGASEIVPGSALHKYCGRTVGHTGPQLFYEGPLNEPKHELSSVGEAWNMYVEKVKMGADAMRACHYFTHSMWYAALLLEKDTIILPDGETDGGCLDIAGVPKDDPMEICAKSTRADQKCSEPVVGLLTTPLLLFATVTSSLACLITCVALFGMFVLSRIQNYDWIYGVDYAKYGKDRNSLLSLVCPCCAKKRRKITRLDVDKAKVARIRAIEARSRKLEAKVQRRAEKGKPIQLGDSRMLDALDMSIEERKVKEQMDKTALSEGKGHLHHDIWVRIVGGYHLRDAEWYGTVNPICVCQIDEKPSSRIVTDCVYDSRNPTWNKVGKLNDWCDGDSISVIVWEKDTLSEIPEDGELLGEVVISNPCYFPSGLPESDITLNIDGESTHQYVRLEIAVTLKGADHELPRHWYASQPQAVTFGTPVSTAEVAPLLQVEKSHSTA